MNGDPRSTMMVIHVHVPAVLGASLTVGRPSALAGVLAADWRARCRWSRVAVPACR
jgi:hypothetical protein